MCARAKNFVPMDCSSFFLVIVVSVSANRLHQMMKRLWAGLTVRAQSTSCLSFCSMTSKKNHSGQLLVGMKPSCFSVARFVSQESGIRLIASCHHHHILVTVVRKWPHLHLHLSYVQLWAISVNYMAAPMRWAQPCETNMHSNCPAYKLISTPISRHHITWEKIPFIRTIRSIVKNVVYNEQNN